MAYAKNSTSPEVLGRGRFVVAGGEYLPEQLLPDHTLPTLAKGATGAGDEAFEVVMFQGTIVTAAGVVKPVGSGAPIGVLGADAYRPFEHGDSEPALVLHKGYVEWPLVTITNNSDAVVYDNSTLAVGDFVKGDAYGRPVKWDSEDDALNLIVGRVAVLETFDGSAGVKYDFGGLDKALLPENGFDRALVAKALTAAGILGARPNLSGFEFAAIERIAAGTNVKTVTVKGAVRVLVNL